MVLEALLPKEILPTGWLRKQLETQAQGLSGNLDKIWPDIRESKWLGGDREGWERLPYFLDGFIPLAYLLGDEEKKARARNYINCILEGQDEEGRFRPKNDTDEKNEDIWSQFLLLKVLTVYADCSGDSRIENAVRRGLVFIDKLLSGRALSNWAASRWYECLVSVLWLYKRGREEWLIRLARRLKAQGIDFKEAIGLWKEARNEWTYETHVVNIAMALKSDALFCELTGEKSAGLAEEMLETLDRFHGTAYGHFTGDECLSGNSAVQGSELCGVVEAMYSYEWLAALTGEGKWGDRLESLAFNALPAAISADMWTHQYDQQVNQIACVRFEKQIFRTNGPESNLFGLEPNFGCCTANFGQGWPKFALSAYRKKGQRIAVLSPVPARIKTSVHGKDTTLVCDSEYPFRSRFTLTADRRTGVLVRIPAWAKPACKAAYRQEKGWMEITLEAGKPVEVSFLSEPRLEKSPEGGYCLKYGALLFALPVAAKREMREYTADGVERKFPYCDYSLSPAGEWRYAFASDSFEAEECEYELPFDRERPPLKIKAELAPVEWKFEPGYDFVAARIPGNKRRGKNVALKLQPYGATDLRVSVLALTRGDSSEKEE